MAITKDVTRLSSQQESFLLGVEKSIKATRFSDFGDQRYFLDQQAKTLVRLTIVIRHRGVVSDSILVKISPPVVLFRV